MEVVLAGYNIDSEIINELKKKALWKLDNVTPETISAAYARISRDPSDIGKLREISRIETEKARSSNRTIIFGLGHASVAEHAVFNFDVTGISRIAVEEIQKFRLASFTEKSQRYIKLDGDFVLPDEIKGTPLEKKMKKLIKYQNDSYFQIYEKLREHLYAKFPKKAADKKERALLDGMAKEDARYVVSLSTVSQFGMTVNARTLENMIRKFNSSHLEEIRSLGKKLYDTVHSISPSIIKYTKPTAYDTDRLEKMVNIIDKYGLKKESSYDNETVKLINVTKDPDTVLCSSLIYNVTQNSYEACFKSASKLTKKQMRELIKASMCSKESHDKVERAFETVEFAYEIILSATNYAQIKRHRISTQIPQDYDTTLGCTVPPSVIEAGLTSIFNETMKKSEDLFNELSKQLPAVKDYALTNAHRRRLFMKLNARELYHFVSLREDEHAQWDIRETAKAMKKAAQSAAPLTSMMLSGKSEFIKCRDKLFN